jgi:hypothetical protein
LAAVEAIGDALEAQEGKQYSYSLLWYIEQSLGGFLGAPGVRLIFLPTILMNS